MEISLMIHVIATIEIVDGKRDEFLTVFHQLVPKVYAEPGCIEYGPHVDVDTGLERQGGVRPDVITVLEKWKDVPALAKHLQAPHMAEFREQVKDLVKGVKLAVVKAA